MSLAGKIALVTGASRGIGRAIASALGGAGATVYVTGRTSSPAPDPPPGTIEAAARAVDAAGGRGVAVRCDHADASQIAALFARIAGESGRLDLLVNNAHSGVHEIATSTGRRFWELDDSSWDAMNAAGLRGHFLASVHAARLMVPRHAGAIVNISSFGALSYLFHAAYGIGKAAVDRMTRDLAFELAPERIAVVSLWPGLVRTETTEAALAGATAGYRRIYEAYAEPPIRAGHAVVALASDPGLRRRTGTVQIAAEVMRRHGMRDDDGRRPDSPRSLRTLARAALPGGWRRFAAIVPPANVPLAVVGPVLTRFSRGLKERGGFQA